MSRLRCLRRGIPSKTQGDRLAVRNKKSKKIESKAHARPIHPINKDPAFPWPPKHCEIIFILLRLAPLLHHYVVHVGWFVVFLDQEEKDLKFGIDIVKVEISLSRHKTHTR